MPCTHGGSNDISNLQTLCESCNAIKASREDWGRT
jgi:5-methylcytosine-specific restriction endonuclease McrA